MSVLRGKSGSGADLLPCRSLTQSQLLHCNRVHPTGTPAKSTRRMIDATLIRQRFEAVAPFLDERGRRLVAASEAVAAGHGGITAVAAATGISRATIGRGIVEISRGEERLSGRVRRPSGGHKPTIEKDHLEADGAGGNTWPIYRIRRPGGGRKLTEEKYPTILTALEQMLENEVAGDPMTEQKWIQAAYGG